MRTRSFVVGGLLLVGVLATVRSSGQDPSDEARTGTMRPVIRGRTQAAASMKPEATRAAERILQAGGNAFDAAVAGQAVLGLVDAASNGSCARRRRWRSRSSARRGSTCSARAT